MITRRELLTGAAAFAGAAALPPTARAQNSTATGAGLPPSAATGKAEPPSG